MRPSTSTSRQEPSRRACVCHGSQRDSDGWEGVATERARGHGEMAMTRGCVHALARQLKHDHQRATRKAYWDFIYQTMEDPFITEAGVLKLLQNIKVDKATGPDAIVARVMRETAVDLAGSCPHHHLHALNRHRVGT